MAKSFHELSPRAQTIVFGLLVRRSSSGGAWQMLLGPARGRDRSRREAHLATLEGDVARAQRVASALAGRCSARCARSRRRSARPRR